jgi:hypothetical protein
MQYRPYKTFFFESSRRRSWKIPSGLERSRALSYVRKRPRRSNNVSENIHERPRTFKNISCERPVIFKFYFLNFVKKKMYSNRNAAENHPPFKNLI